MPSLARLALSAAQTSPARENLAQAIDLVRQRAAAVGAVVFYGENGQFTGCGVIDDPAAYPPEALMYLQQRLVQLRAPLAFNLQDGAVRFLTRAANKQRRDYVAWLMPAADTWTEMLVLRGFWPGDAIGPLLALVESAMPALTIILERYLGAGRSERLERQLFTISSSVEILDRAAEVIGSVAAVYPSMAGLPDDQINLLRTLASQAACALDEVKTHRDIMETHLRLQQYTLDYTIRLEDAVQAERQNANTDALTGLTNYRGALRTLEESFATADRQAQALSLLMVDVDGFKLFNDTHGHIVGDGVLRLVAETLRKATGDRGEVCRYGGDEFLVILPAIKKEAAKAIATRVAERLTRAEFRGDTTSRIPVSASIGVASYPEDTSSPAKLVALADAAMYAAKRRARSAETTVVANGEDTTFGVLDSLVQAIDAKDRYTKAHCDIVAEYAVKIAEQMDLPAQSKRALRVAGLLHDVGKLIVADEILKKPAPLTMEEYEAMQRHVVIGEALLREVPSMGEVTQAVACHHERYDGTGYPRGLRGKDTPLIGRIISVADAYSAMRLDRPYRKGMTHDRVLNELVSGAGIQFDPEITKVLVALLLEEELAKERATRGRHAA